MEKGDFYINGPVLIRFSDECRLARNKADALSAYLRRARLYAAGENEQEYCWLLRRTDALSEYFRQMSKAAEVTYDETDSAARQIRRLLEAHQNTMRHLRLLASD